MSSTDEQDSRPPTILIVDDDRGLLRLVERLLQREGFVTAAADSFADAVKWLEEHQPDLMLLDLKLGEIGGRDLVDYLTVHGRQVPFIVITGQGDERVAVEMMKRGAMDYLVKDGEFLQFVPQVVRRALNQLERDKKLAIAEEALRRSEANLAKAQQIAHLGSYELNVNSRFGNYRSDEIYRILGMNPSERELSDQEYLEQMVHPKDRSEYREALNRSIREAAPLSLEYRVIRPDGSVRHVQSIGEAVVDRTGQVVKLVGTLLDITDRKRAELRQAVQNITTRALAESATLREAAPRILQAVCQTLDWDYGEFWEVDTAGSAWRRIESWPPGNPVSILKPVDVAAVPVPVPDKEKNLAKASSGTRKPIWTCNLDREFDLLPPGIVLPPDVNCAVSVPVLLGSEVLGNAVFLCYDVRPPDPDLIQMLTVLGSQIGQFVERKRLEQEILHISEMEQRRIGGDLHDGLCQHLAATALRAEILEQKLARKSKTDAARVAEIAKYVRDGIVQTRLLARGLSPVVIETEGLMSALEELAVYTERMFGIQCEFKCDVPVHIQDHGTATHLYRIAQEAISNAFRHGNAERITMVLTRSAGQILLRVQDNGIGLPADVSKAKGMGLRIMRYRAAIIGGQLTIERQPKGGTVIVCSVADESGQKTEGSA